MAPAGVARILVVGVLAVVNEQVALTRELESRYPLTLEARQIRTERRLVVRDVAERRIPCGDPVAESGAAMRDRFGTDRGRVEFPFRGRGVAERDRAGKLAHLDRGEWRGDVACDAILERRLGRGRAPDRDLRIRAEARRKEHQALDVVEVKVSEQDVDPRSSQEFEPQRANSRAGVEDQLLATREHDLHAGGVAAVAVHAGAGSRYRSACSPDLDLHVSLQKKIIAPEVPSSEATMGTALASIPWFSPSADRILNRAWAGRPSRIDALNGRSRTLTGFPSSAKGPNVAVHS